MKTESTHILLDRQRRLQSILSCPESKPWAVEFAHFTVEEIRQEIERRHNEQAQDKVNRTEGVRLMCLLDGVEELNAQLQQALLIEDVGEMTYKVQAISRALRIITNNAKG